MRVKLGLVLDDGEDENVKGLALTKVGPSGPTELDW